MVWWSFASRLARFHATQGMAQRAVGSGLVEDSVRWLRSQQNRRNQSAARQKGVGKVPSKGVRLAAVLALLQNSDEENGAEVV